MAKLSVLISGAGIAGPTLAYWLAKSKQDISVTIVERASSLRSTGQAIDIRGAAVKVIQRMGLEDAIREKNTTEEGIKFINSKGESVAEFPATGSTKSQSFTSEFEILRSDLAQIMYEVSKDCATYVFGEYITGVEQSDDKGGKVQVEFANGMPPASFDLVVGADGMISRTRRLAFGSGDDDSDYLKPLGQLFCFFTMPDLGMGDRWARWYNATGGRLIFTRPTRKGSTGVCVGVTRPELNRFEEATKQGPDAIKNLLRAEFEGAGWLTEDVLDGMDTSSDFYGQMVAQVRMAEFVKGNVALLGDAGYCPSPISGMGTALAILGAYILAGEVSESPSDMSAALRRYQLVMREVVDKAQKLFPGAPQIANPRSARGISVLHKVMGVLGSSVVRKVAGSLTLPETWKRAWKLPIYPMLETT